MAMKTINFSNYDGFMKEVNHYIQIMINAKSDDLRSIRNRSLGNFERFQYVMDTIYGLEIYRIKHEPFWIVEVEESDALTHFLLKFS